MYHSGETTMSDETLTTICRPVADSLAAVRGLIRDEIGTADGSLRGPWEYLLNNEGKMLRPAVLLLAGAAAGSVNTTHIQLAAAVELLHQATLIHDDVLDEASIRHHRPTAASLWGNEGSVLLGDFLLSRVFDLCNRAGDPQASQAISTTAPEICQGELSQCLARGRWDMTESEYLGIITLKTSRLYRLCGYLGGHLSAADPTVVDALAHYGENIGLAFQISDDILDILGEESLTGKTLGTDLAQRKATLPVIHWVRHAGASASHRLAELGEASDTESPRLDEQQIDGIRALLAGSESLEYARSEARAYVRRAEEQLLVLPPSPAHYAMAAIGEFVVRRSC